jgi:fibronectin-binding autotransporter adhesin
VKASRRLASFSGLALSLHLLLADVARAVNLDWINAAGGAAGVAGNWNPAQVPAAADWLSFALNSLYTVTFGAAVPASDHLSVEDGTVTFRFPTAHTNATVLGVAQNGIDAEAVIESGSLTLQRNLYVAATAGHTGTLSITGAGTAVTATSATGVTSVGEQGTGTLNVLDGAVLTLANAPEFGDRAGGLGALVVGGVSGTTRAQLIVNNSPTDPMELGSNGVGSGGALSGGWISVAGTVQLGKDPGGSGTLTTALVSGADSATTLIGGDLKIARNDVAGTAGGSGLFSVQGGGIADVAGTTYTFDADGSDGELELREGGRFETGSLVVGDPATELDLGGGLLQVRAGLLDLSDRPLVLNSATGSPTLELLDGAQADLGSASGPTLVVGENAAGTLRVLSGSDLAVRDFNLVVGDDPGGDGRLDVNHAGSTLTVDHTLLVGRAGAGTVRLDGDATGTVNTLGIATQPGSDGALTLSGAGTTLRVADDAEVAGLATGASLAPGELVVTNGARAWLDRPGISGRVWDTGVVTVGPSAELNLAGSLLLRGRLVLSTGATLGGAIQPIAGGRITGQGSALSSVFSVVDTTGRLEPSGDLTAGDAAAPLGFQFLGTTAVGGAVLTLADLDSAVVGTVTMSGGRLVGPAGGIHLVAGRRITGTGTIDGAIRPLGRILPTGANGITFRGAVLGVGEGMNGSRVHFAPGSSFLGFGRIEASVQVDTGAVILPASDITLGASPIASSVTIDGTLAIGPGVEVDLNGTDSTRVSGLLSMTRGYVSSLPAGPLVLRPAGRIVGNGTIVGSTFNAGTIDTAPGVNDLAFQTLWMQGGGRLRFDVGDFAAGERDTLVVTGAAVLAGTLELNTLPGFLPVAGDSFPVMTYASRAGTFDAVTLNGNPATGLLEIVYRPTGAWAKVLVNTLDSPTGPVAGATRAIRFASVGSPARTLTFALDLPAAADARVEVFDVSGRRLATLHDGALPAGAHRFDGTASAPTGGLCFARATVRDAQGVTVRTARGVRIP